jgi:hypothetical protein
MILLQIIAKLNVFFHILGNLAWIRKSSTFYKSLTKRNSDGSITAFYSPQFSPSDKEILDDFESPQYSPSFIETLNPDQAKRIVYDISPADYSNIGIGNRILVEESANTAALGVVIGKENVSIYTELYYKVTVRLDFNNTDVVLGGQSVWQLPHHLDENGKHIFERISNFLVQYCSEVS